MRKLFRIFCVVTLICLAASASYAAPPQRKNLPPAPL
jgi:hypothetical protein